MGENEVANTCYLDEAPCPYKMPLDLDHGANICKICILHKIYTEVKLLKVSQ